MTTRKAKTADDTPKPDYSKFLERPKNPIQYAFTVNNVHYWTFEGLTKMPIRRYEALAEIDYNLKEKVDKTYLLGLATALEEIINEDKINRAQIGQLAGHLKERLTFISDTEVLYMKAAVLYFDYDERLSVFDYDHADKKIASWKTADIDDFFLKAQLYPPELYMNTSLMNFQTYTRKSSGKVVTSLELVLSIISGSDTNPVLVSSIQSLLETYRKLNTLAT